VIVRRAETADASALSLAGAATFLETFADALDGHDIVAHCVREHSAARYLGWLNRPGAAVWAVATPDTGTIVGYMVCDRAALPIADPRPTDYEVKRIYLLRRFQGGGIGRRLVELAAAEARTLGSDRLLLGVYVGNEPAIAFYRHLGFTVCGGRKFRVGARECDDHIMSLDLG
jgi:ribosomal protein S18 acetylase RimI-like enzyme